jgi:hypothetical protein
VSGEWRDDHEIVGVIGAERVSGSGSGTSSVAAIAPTWFWMDGVRMRKDESG